MSNIIGYININVDLKCLVHMLINSTHLECASLSEFINEIKLKYAFLFSVQMYKST